MVVMIAIPPPGLPPLRLDTSVSMSTTVRAAVLLLAIFLIVASLRAVIVPALAARSTRRYFSQRHGCEALSQWARQLDPVLGSDIVVANSRNLSNGMYAAGLRHRHARFGRTYGTRVLGKVGISTIEPANVQAVFATRSKDFVLPDRRQQLRPLAGNGIFTSDGEQWAHSRALLRPNFARGRVHDLSMLERHSRALIAAVNSYKGRSFDMHALAQMFTMDTASELVFGKSADTLASAHSGTYVSEKEREDVEAFNRYANGVETEIVKRIRSWRALVGSYSNKSDFDVLIGKVYDFADGYVERAVREQKKEKENPSETNSKKHPYILLDELASTIPHDRERIRYELLNVFFAGRNTTAALIANMFWMVSRRPDVQATLRKELSEMLVDGPPNVEQLQRLPYVRAVVHETLRLTPPTPLTSRKAAVDTVLPSGGGDDGNAPLLVHAGTSVNVSIHALHRDTDLWGPDADDFKPERWLKGHPKDWAFMPFLRGPRACLGRDLAITEVSYLLVRLLQAFPNGVEKGIRVHSVEEVVEGVGEPAGDNWVESVSISAHCRGGTWVRFPL